MRVLGTVLAYIRFHHIGFLALIVALGGTSYAATKLPPSSVDTKQIRKNAVTSAKIRDGTISLADLSTRAALDLRGSQGPSGGAGPPGPPGPGAVSRWALFNADGSIVTQSGGISLAAKGTSDYFIDMGTQVTGHPLLATISQKGGGFGAKILAGPCGGPPEGQDCSPSIGATADADGRHVHVYIADGTTSTPQPFYLVLLP